MVSAATPFCGKVSRRTVSRATFWGEAFNGYFLAWAAFCAMHKSNSCGAFLLNHGLHARRGGVGPTPLDSVIKVALSPRKDFVKNVRCTRLTV